MERETFERRFLAASASARDFARGFIEERLPDEMRFNLHLNASHDGNAGPEFTLFPEDARDDVALATKNLCADQVVQRLWRGGLVPQWVDITVVGETGDATMLDVVACGRFIGEESKLYYTWTDLAPFSPKGPSLPVGYVDGQRFSIYNRCTCWSLDDLTRAMRHADKVWSLELFGPVFDDDIVSSALESSCVELLEIRGAALHGTGLCGLSRLPRLRVLRLSLGDVDELSLHALPRLEHLENLSIDNLPSVVAGLDRLDVATPNLTSLDLAGASDVVRDLVALPDSLTELHLEFPRVPSWAVPGPRLHTVGLHAPATNDVEVATFLARLPADVENIHLRGTGVSDAILDTIARFRKLRYLDVVDTKVSAEALERFTRARPSLRFHPRPMGGS